MVAIAQLVEHLIVVQKVACSSHVSHPTKTPRNPRGLFRFRTARPSPRDSGAQNGRFAHQNRAEARSGRVGAPFVFATEAGVSLSRRIVLWVFVCAGGAPYVTGAWAGISRESHGSRAAMRRRERNGPSGRWAVADFPIRNRFRTAGKCGSRCCGPHGTKR